MSSRGGRLIYSRVSKQQNGDAKAKNLHLFVGLKACKVSCATQGEYIHQEKTNMKQIIKQPSGKSSREGT